MTSSVVHSCRRQQINHQRVKRWGQGRLSSTLANIRKSTTESTICHSFIVSRSSRLFLKAGRLSFCWVQRVLLLFSVFDSWLNLVSDEVFCGVGNGSAAQATVSLCQRWAKAMLLLLFRADSQAGLMRNSLSQTQRLPDSPPLPPPPLCKGWHHTKKKGC